MQNTDSLEPIQTDKEKVGGAFNDASSSSTLVPLFYRLLDRASPQKKIVAMTIMNSYTRKISQQFEKCHLFSKRKDFSVTCGNQRQQSKTLNYTEDDFKTKLHKLLAEYSNKRLNIWRGRSMMHYIMIIMFCPARKMCWGFYKFISGFGFNLDNVKSGGWIKV